MESTIGRRMTELFEEVNSRPLLMLPTTFRVRPRYHLSSMNPGIRFPSLLILGTAIAVASFPASAETSTYFPPPNETWKAVVPTQTGWNQAGLDELIRYAGDNKSSGLLILQNGKILVERYWPEENYNSGDRRFAYFVHGKDAFGSTIEDVASVQKSVAALIVGMAQEKGYLSVEDPVHKHLGKGWSAATPEQEAVITVRHLLAMTSGLLDDLTFEAPAGTRWRYNTTAYSHCMHVVAEATGKPARDIVDRWLCQPLGLNDSAWIYRQGRENAEWRSGNVFGFITSHRDLARIGLMVLNQGRWNGQTILGDEAFLKDATHPSQSLNPSYGYLWWLNGQTIIRRGDGKQTIDGPLIQSAPTDLYAAQGRLSRKLYVVPSMDLIITRLGNQPKDSSFNREFWKRVMAAAPQ